MVGGRRFGLEHLSQLIVTLVCVRYTALEVLMVHSVFFQLFGCDTCLLLDHELVMFLLSGYLGFSFLALLYFIQFLLTTISALFGLDDFFAFRLVLA